MTEMGQQFEACETCGSSPPGRGDVFGSKGCPSCGATIPYSVRASRRVRNRIEFDDLGEQGPYWMRSGGIEHHTVLKRYGAEWSAASNDPRGAFQTHQGRTSKEAMHGLMHKLAAAEGSKWYELDPETGKRLERLRKSEGDY